MAATDRNDWQEKRTTPDKALANIEPGMNIFLGTGAAEPRTLVKHLMASDAPNLQDLTLIQLLSFGDALSFEEIQSYKYRLKTFFSVWVASEAITTGRVDLIPSRFSTIPYLIKSQQLPVDAALIQITPPNDDGYCSLGIAVDVARRAMEQASLVIGEINTNIPRTYGDTFVSVNDFDLLGSFLALSGQRLNRAEGPMLASYEELLGPFYCRHGCGICEPACPHQVPVNDILRYGHYFDAQRREKQAMVKYASLPRPDASRCLDCDAPCEDACPFGVPARALLTRAHQRLVLA